MQNQPQPTNKFQDELPECTKGIKFQRGLYKTLTFLFGKIISFGCNYTYEPYEKKDGTYLILANHNMDIDPVLLTLSLKMHMKFVASANVLQGFFGFFIRKLVNPIPRYKGAPADEVVNFAADNLRNGINVAMFPEGNKSWDGETCYISPRVVSMIRLSNCSLITFKFIGTYLKSPRWANHKRSGPIFGRPVHTIPAEELKKMSDDEIYQIIVNDLNVNVYAKDVVPSSKNKVIAYHSSKSAEGFESLAYLCPTCKCCDSIKSSKNKIRCACGLEAEFDDYGKFSGNIDFTTPYDWNLFQKNYLKTHVDEYKSSTDLPFSTDEDVTFIYRTSARNKNSFKNCKALLYGDKLKILDSDGIILFEFRWENIVKLGMFRNTRVFFTVLVNNEEVRGEIFRKHGVSGIKYYAFWRILTGKPYI